MVQGLVQTYKMDHNSYPTTLVELATTGDIEADAKCPNGKKIKITNGVVSIVVD